MSGEKYNPACGDIMQLLVHVALSFGIESCIHTNFYFIKLEIVEEIQILWSLVSVSVVTILFIISYENSRAVHGTVGYNRLGVPCEHVGVFFKINLSCPNNK